LSRHRLEIRVVPRAGILDPEGKAIHHALHSLGYVGASEVRVGKLIHVDLDADTESAALETGDLMCRRLLANPVTEDYTVGFAPEGAGAPHLAREGA